MLMLFMPAGKFRYESEVPLSKVKKSLNVRARPNCDPCTQLVRGIIGNMRIDNGLLRSTLLALPDEKQSLKIEAQFSQRAHGTLMAEYPHPLGPDFPPYEIVAYATLDPTSPIPLTIVDVVALDLVEGAGLPEYWTSIIPGFGSLAGRVRLAFPRFDLSGNRANGAKTDPIPEPQWF
jgi:hypothetical protein